MKIRQIVKSDRVWLLVALGAVCTPTVLGQHYDMKRWGSDRGYYDAPYFRYEAENNLCKGYSGEYLESSDDQRLLQSEASNQQAITLGRNGYVEWVNDSGEADGVTLRFSVPWGSKATVAIEGNDGTRLGEMNLNTDHSWQYCVKIQGNRNYKPEVYSIHVKNDDEFARMRFDETHTRLSRPIAQGEEFRIVNISDIPVTVDFLEIEKTRKVEYQDGWVRWNRQIDNNIQNFINNHQGQTIYIDEKYVGIYGKLSLGSANLQGRGMWYTELHWDGNGAGFNGFGGSVKDMYLSSYQNQRYNASDHSSGGYGSPGKCFNGTVGNVERVWVEHFECGAWLSGGNGARFSECRFRNNYADGVNLCNSSNSSVEHSSFRNNGDDDMASWSAESYCSNNTFAYNTAEHNWRASSLGFFGGGGHKAHNILVKDGLESGVRLVCDFGGPAFGSEGIRFNDITIVHCACIDGPVGQSGDFWGVNEGALHIESSKSYPIVNPTFENIDILDSRGNAVFIGSGSHNMQNVILRNINVEGVRDPASYAFYFENPKGSALIEDVTISDVMLDRITNVNGGSLESFDSNGFSLQANGVVAGGQELVEGCRLKLSGLSWEAEGKAIGTNLSDGDNVTFKARIDNISDTDLPEGFKIPAELTVDNGTSLWFTPLSSAVPAGDYAVIECKWTATHGGLTVTATLDPQDRFEDMTPAEHGSVTKKINVGITEIGDIPFERTQGVDFQPIDLRWRTSDSSPFGKESIHEGDRVTFAAVVANTGTVSSEGGTKLGVLISPSGNGWTQGDNDIRWSDKNEAYEGLSAGEAKHFKTYGGNNSSDGVWIARNGSFNILVHANDHANENGNRSEDNTGNNQRFFALTIPYEVGSLHDNPDLPDDLSVPVGIDTIAPDIAGQPEEWYTVTGIRLSQRPTVPGIYICAGRKYVVR